MIIMKNLFFSVTLVLLVNSCTSNPAGGDDIAGTKNTVAGNISLDINNQPERAYVWLDEFKIGAYSEPDGSFSLSIPPGLNSNVDGFFKLYFYVANYVLNTVEVGIRNGEFIPNEAALGKNGKLRQNIVLEQFLSVKTMVSPSSVTPQYSGDITIQSTFKTTNEDTSTIIIPNSIGDFLGPVFFQNMNTGQTFSFEGISLETVARITIGSSPTERFVTFSFNSLGLPTGEYRVVPVLFIKHQDIPPALLDSIDENLDFLGNYFKIPLSFEGGEFEVL